MAKYKEKCWRNYDKNVLTKFIGATTLSDDRTNEKTCEDPSCTVVNLNCPEKGDISSWSLLDRDRYVLKILLKEQKGSCSVTLSCRIQVVGISPFRLNFVCFGILNTLLHLTTLPVVIFHCLPFVFVFLTFTYISFVRIPRHRHDKGGNRMFL